MKILCFFQHGVVRLSIMICLLSVLSWFELVNGSFVILCEQASTLLIQQAFKHYNSWVKPFRKRSISSLSQSQHSHEVQAFSSPVSLHYARNAWDHDSPFGDQIRWPWQWSAYMFRLELSYRNLSNWHCL